MSNPFTQTALADGRAAYQPGQSAADAWDALTDALVQIERVDKRPMPLKERSRYKVAFWIGWVSERMRRRAEQRRMV